MCVCMYSDIRDIPDNQEIYVDLNSDQSIIFEILEMVEKQDEEAAK
jgi:hypothetical protein